MRAVRAVVWLWDHSIGFVLTCILIGVISLYRLTVSPMLPPTCRYHPSCSAYGLEATRRHYAVKGTLLICWRLVRCNPWSQGGLDPVPQRGYWLPDVHPNGEPRHETIGTRGVSQSRSQGDPRVHDSNV